MITSYPKISDSTCKNLKALLVGILWHIQDSGGWRLLNQAEKNLRNKLIKRDVTFSLVVLQANSLSLFYHRYVVFWSTR